MANNNEILPLDHLSLFLTVVEMGGFRSAAKRLGLAPSTVSEKLAELEARIGTPLLVRTTRSVMTTEAGRTLAARLKPLFVSARDALQDATSSQLEIRGRLKLNVTVAVMVDILPPIIDRFLAAYPKVNLEVICDDRLVDIVSSGFDAGIRYGEHLAKDMIAIPIGPRIQTAALAASPSYLTKFGTPLVPQDLLSHACIRVRFSSGALVAWELKREQEIVTVDPPARIVVNVNSAVSSIEHAKRGHGIVSAFENWLRPSFSSGDLVPVMAEWWPNFEGPWIYYSSRFTPAPLRAFVNLVNEH